MLRVMTIVGTRPELIRLSRTIALLDRHCAHTLVHTGQNYDYELNQIFFRELGMRKPDYFLKAAAKSVAQTIGNVIVILKEMFKHAVQWGHLDANPVQYVERPRGEGLRHEGALSLGTGLVDLRALRRRRRARRTGSAP